jgi:cell division protein ZipA
MTELRVALIVLGAVFLAVLLLWERRRSSHKLRAAPPPELSQPPQGSASATSSPARSRRMEPSIEDFSPGQAELPESLDVPTIHPVEPVRVEVMREVAVDVPGAAAKAEAAREPAQPATAVIRWPPPRTDRVLTVRVVRADGLALPGRDLRLALEAAGMIHGPQRIFHMVDAEGSVRASAANLMRPGSFDPAQMDTQEFRGLSLFCVLPGTVAATRMLDDLLGLAHAVAGRLGAVAQDEQGGALAGERLAQLRRSLSPPPPDGAPA